MHPTTQAMLDKSPHPVRWGLSMLVWLALGIALNKVGISLLSVPAFIMFGLSVGLYFGNYRGRFDVMNAWQNELKQDRNEIRENLGVLDVERERIQRQEICSDKSHWSKT